MARTIQKEQILKYLKEHKDGITPVEAYEIFRCFRLGARIYDLKKEGHKIITNIERNDTGTHYARYQLQGNI